MKVFVLRHAVTEEGESAVHQQHKSVLSVQGINQAKQIATNFSDLKLDRIYTSPDERARQTAAIVSSHFENPVEVICHEGLREMRKPAFFAGKPYSDLEVVTQKSEMYKNITDPSFRLPGGENIFDVKERIDQVLDELEKCLFESVLMITHSALIRVMILHIYSEKENIPFDSMVRLYPVIREGMDIDHGQGFEMSLFGKNADRTVPGRLLWEFSFTTLPEKHLVSWRPGAPDKDDE